MSDLLTRAEAARRAGLSVVSIDKLIRAGGLESVKIGRLRRVPADAVDRYIRTNGVRAQRAGDATERRIQELIAAAPALSEAQKSRLRQLLGPVTVGGNGAVP